MTEQMKQKSIVAEAGKKKRQSPLVIRAYKDTVFRLIFAKKTELLSLFNAVNRTHYDNPDELEINTLDNAIYLNMKNDISCVLDSQLNLYEHQSTVNQNMPLRDLFYVARMYEAMLQGDRLYGSQAVELPAPKFIVFYNGERPQPERRLMCLSDLYTRKTDDPGLELVVVQLNINPGFNEDLKKNCPSLFGYMAYVEKVRKYQRMVPLADAVEQAVSECIKEGILADFFRKNRAEVVQMSIFEYDQEAHMKVIREESWESGRMIGREEGREEGRDGINKLISCLIADNRLKDLQRSAGDEEYQNQLMKEYGIFQKE